MKDVVLARVQGPRLRALTENIPKPLIPITTKTPFDEPDILEENLENENKISMLSYNILGGEYADEMLDKLKTVIDKPDIACFQEFPKKGSLSSKFEHYFGDNYSSEKSLSLILLKRKMGLVTFYNNRRFRSQKSKILYLPTPRWTIWEKMFTWSFSDGIYGPYDRTALITILEYNKTHLVVVNTHLAWEGRKKHQMYQLEYILKEIKELNIKKGRVILCGDFNLNIFSNKEAHPFLEKLEQEGFYDTTNNIVYSADSASPFSFPKDKTRIFKYMLKSILRFLGKIGMNTKRKVDYIFSKDIKNTFSGSFEINGSDHYPILVYFAL